MADGQVWTIGSILKWSEQYFGSHGADTPRLDAEVLLSHLLGQKRIFLYVHFDQPLTAEELARYREMVKRRAAGEPVAYICGEKEFMGLTFKVTPAVLVPRPDTETLVEAAIERLKGKEGARIADVCTGSGAIALALAHYLPESSVTATDISSDALEIAKQNAETLGLSERVQFFEGDLLAPLAGETFDAIVSNPPYIPGAEIEGLPREVRAEPKIALDGGADGLDFYRRLVRESSALLKDGGFLAVECGDTQAGAIAEMAKDGGFGKTEIVRDLADKERVIVLWKA
ncbi:MAG: peptide chain release factor N(5)-glutamine methyltransferase [Schwartzia sp.]|nr:peptide chain release factor N(5)-glutamine methyltransferase [Schwartzia sp. (in: firmicutes)]